MAEFYPFKSQKEIFFNVGPVLHFREIIEEISISEKRAGAEFNVGYSPTFNKISLILSAGLSGTGSSSGLDGHLLYIKSNVGIRFNLQ